MKLPPQTRSFFDELLHYTQQKNLQKGRALHARIIKTGFFSCTFLANSLVNFYAKCRQLSEASLVFEVIPCKDVVSWNCLINGYSQQGSAGSSIVMQLFQRMRSQNVLPNSHTLAGSFTAASILGSTREGRQAHALALKTASFGDVYVGSSLLNMYCKGGLVDEARKVFDRMPVKNSVSWATMISGYAVQRRELKAMELFKLIHQEENEGWNEFVFTGMLSALAHPQFVLIGRQVHALAVETGILGFVPVQNALVTMYLKCGCLNDGLQMFDLSLDRNSITWSAMISGYAQSGRSLEALKLFSRMHSNGLEPSEYTFVGVLNACSDIGWLEEGKQAHSFLLKLGYESQIFVTTALVDMYAKCGSAEDARKGFGYLQELDVVLWTSMIGGYVQNAKNEEALILFGQMQMEGIFPNELTMISILKACSSLAAVELGKQIHGHTIKHGFCLEVPIGSALSNMYAKCGSLEDGNLVFRRMATRDVISWNAMISGLSQNGRGNEALSLFEEMLEEGTKPDHVTFLNVLSACSHMGLVERGWTYFNMMNENFGLVPGVEHYACVVDILSRAGRLEEAKKFIESATVDQAICLWRVLLSACITYRDYELGAHAGEKLMELGSQESSAYVLLSRIYTALGRLEDVERVMRLMRLRGVSKEPGCSWIELKSQVHVFVVGDAMHPQIEEIRKEIRKLSKQMKDEGYGPNIDSASSPSCIFCAEEVQKGNSEFVVASV